jgi:hypothetical protein
MEVQNKSCIDATLSQARTCSKFQSLHPPCRSVICTLTNGTMLVHDPNAPAANTTALEVLTATCGALELSGIVTSLPCNLQFCNRYPWTVGTWQPCKARCGPAALGKATAVGYQVRSVRCIAPGGTCAGKAPISMQPCTILCDACALSQTCGAAGTCKCASYAPCLPLSVNSERRGSSREGTP